MKVSKSMERIQDMVFANLRDCILDRIKENFERYDLVDSWEKEKKELEHCANATCIVLRELVTGYVEKYEEPK